MANEEVTVRAPNSLILIGDPACDPPESMSGGLVGVSPGCVAVGTLSEADGATRIYLVEDGHLPDSTTELAFSGEIETPSRRLVVSSVLDDIFFDRGVSSQSVFVQVWVNDEAEPDQIAVLVSTSRSPRM